MKRILCLILVLAMLPGLPGCRTPEFRTPGEFYYYRTDTRFSGTDGVLAPETRELDGIEGDLDAILALYCQGPQSLELENPLGGDCPAPAWSLGDGTLNLHFSSEFAQHSGMELTVAAACLARTFLPMTGADTLVLTAQDSLLDGESAMTVTLSDLGLRDDTQDRLHGDFTVYYADADRKYLISRSISLFLTSREELPMLLLTQMYTAPQDASLQSVLPEGTQIRSVVTEDGLCIVDLSREFVSNRSYSPSAQLLSVYGIVNTLTALPEISRVELSIEGELLLRLGSVALSGPLSSDDRFLGPVRTALGERDSTVYLVNGQDPGLLPVPLRLRHSAAYSQAEQMIRFLLSDSGSNGIHSCISSGTQLKSLRVERRICHVDLSSDFLDRGSELKWAIRVIAASLCTLEGISAVRITVDGAVPEGYPDAWFGVLVPKSDWFL